MAIGVGNLRVDRTSFFVGSTSSGKSSPFFVSTSKGKLFGLSFSSHSVCKINFTVNHKVHKAYNISGWHTLYSVFMNLFGGIICLQSVFASLTPAIQFLLERQKCKFWILKDHSKIN